MKGTFTVAGQRVRTSSQRRFVIFLVYRTIHDTERVEVYKRTDSREKARQIVQGYGFSSARRLVTVDTVTGETVERREGI